MKPNETGKKPRGNPRIVDAGIATRFKPGRSANPGGRPRRTPYADAHRTVADLSVADLRSSTDDPVAIGIAKAMARAALAGKISAAVECANRAEGTPHQTVNVHEDDTVEPKLTIGQTVAKIREAYGLANPKASVAEDQSGKAEDSVAKATVRDSSEVGED